MQPYCNEDSESILQRHVARVSDMRNGALTHATLHANDLSVANRFTPRKHQFNGKIIRPLSITQTPLPRRLTAQTFEAFH